ncbi:MAG: DMT family transporter [Brevundimonas sp.]|uniref:DMT family transporter n=1 Tax=Brevundimonas sp. TaxID=1871086 RepID=UPI00391C970E
MAPFRSLYRPRARTLAIASVLICALIWGTTWYAITLQLGTVDPIASISYRFGIAAAILFAFCLLTGRSLKLTRAQHLAALGQGLFVFAIDYAFVYWAEERIASAVVAVIFAALAFVNLIAFRVVAGQKASGWAWGGAMLGMAGVAVLFASELVRAELDPRALTGLIFAVIAVLGAAIGNLYAWRGQVLGTPVIQATAWAMAYGTGLLVIYGLVTGVAWTYEASWSYALSLAHLSLLGSVVAFLLYFKLARSSGYALASYISALTPPVAMVVSVLFEDARFGIGAFAGLALVLLGQALLIRAPKLSDA